MLLYANSTEPSHSITESCIVLEFCSGMSYNYSVLSHCPPLIKVITVIVLFTYWSQSGSQTMGEYSILWWWRGMRVREPCVAPWMGNNKWGALPWLCSKELFLIKKKSKNQINKTNQINHLARVTDSESLPGCVSLQAHFFPWQSPRGFPPATSCWESDAQYKVWKYFFGKKRSFPGKEGRIHHYPFFGLAPACFAQPLTSSCSLTAVLQRTFSLCICSFAGALFDIVCLPT